ncbi:MAG: triose-phosphate isomerase [Planctomycetales bacterium 4484_123]|nr:MAG: triose-phosphate isomerase [Planctomycetales bacterium 4484_123]
MPRKLFIAGNWKMNTNAASARALAEALVEKIGSVEAVDLAVCPPFVYLSAVGEVLAASRIALGAQDVYYEDDGAFTGEVSTAMLKDVGCSYVICGHSERRHVIGETDELINRKLLKALGDGLRPILCVGELLEERRAEETLEVVRRQVQLGLEGVSGGDVDKVTIAYEPVWAIGTGVVATPEQAQEVHAMIREVLAQLYDQAIAEAMRIQYGGSVKPKNAEALLACPDVDGALVGGASLKADQFAEIVSKGLGG